MKSYAKVEGKHLFSNGVRIYEVPEGDDFTIERYESYEKNRIQKASTIIIFSAYHDHASDFSA